MLLRGMDRYSLAIILFIFVYGMFRLYRAQRRSRRLCAEIVAAAGVPGDKVGGHTVHYWVEKVNKDPRILLDVEQAYVLKCFGHDYWFVDGTYYATTYGRFGSSLIQRSVQYLIACGVSAEEKLSSQSPLFKQIAVAKDVKVFSITRLAAFASLLKAGGSSC